MSSNPTGQGYTEPNSASLLDQVRRYIAQTKSGKTSSNAYTPSYGVTAKDSASVADAVSTTSTAIGIFDVIDDSANQKLWLSFDSDVVDKSGNANNGTVTGTTTYTTDINRYFDGRYSKAFSFDGSSYITIANENSFDFERNVAMSLSFWFNLPSVPATNPSIFVKANDATTAASVGYGAFFSAIPRLHFRMKDGAVRIGKRSSTILTTGQWYHGAITKGTGTTEAAIKIYIDSVNVTENDVAGTLTATTTNALSPVVGAESDAGEILTASLDDLQVWNIELSQAEITTLAQARQISHNAAVLQPSYASFFDVAA